MAEIHGIKLFLLEVTINVVVRSQNSKVVQKSGYDYLSLNLLQWITVTLQNLECGFQISGR